MNGKDAARRTLLTATILLFAATAAADPTDEPAKKMPLSPDVARSIRALRLGGEQLTIDGLLDEAAWRRADDVSGFTQTMPLDGEPASEETSVRLLYDDHAIYVGIRAFDGEADKIRARLARRDDECRSDWVHVYFDSYDDNRTAFCFCVNPAGSRMDGLIFDDNSSDMNWDAVWNVATTIDGGGWTAEFAIPFSQLRYNGNPEWGFQVRRFIDRKSEESFWARKPKEDNRYVSLFGTVEGLDRLPHARRLEVMPYAVSSIDTWGAQDDDPFRNNPAGDFRPGIDLKYGLTSNMTLDATINPDFGQVEQDPSEFNLTAYESYFAEKRPFFIEGSSLFQFRLMFGDGDAERLFYSRRIGRSPQFSPLDSGRFEGMDTDEFYEQTPHFTTILGAAKITGRTESGWSIGILDAVTDKEEAQVGLPGGERQAIAVEPMTNYLVGRARKDFNEGRTAFGAIMTSVSRDLPNEDMAWLNRNAFTGGLDLTHRFAGGGYQIDVSVMGSHLRGSTEAILDAQTSSARYFQRPDADHVSVDSMATHMEGFGAKIWCGKFSEGHFRFGLGAVTRSPGFECNDLGYMRRADHNLAVYWMQWRDWEPGRFVKQYSANVNLWRGWDWDGEVYDLGGNINGWCEFVNEWDAYSGINRSQSHPSFTLLRGGPSMLVPGGWSWWHGINTDTRKPIVLGYDGDFYTDDEGFDRYQAAPWVQVKPSSCFDMRVSASWNDRRIGCQYVDEIDGSFVVARLDQRIFSMTTRFNYTITPRMSLQLYAMPFVTAGKYSDFREVTDPRADRYENRFTTYDYEDDPDFNFKQLRSNLVFRWEYSPGSTLYLVWSRGATHYEEEYGRYSLGRDLDRMWDAPSDNTFLVKFNKWFSL